MTIKKWLQINELGHTWLPPIITAIMNSGKGPLTVETHRYGYFASLKNEMIKRLIDRLNEESNVFFDRARQHEPHHVFTPNNPDSSYAFEVDDAIKYRFMLDNDLLLFEIDSCCELIKKFLSGIYLHIGINHDYRKISRHIAHLIQASGKDVSWFLILDKERNFFIHEGAPYHAIDISTEKYDLIIMKDNLKTFNDPNKFITLEEINKVISGFNNSIFIIKNHIISLFKDNKKLSSKSLSFIM